MAEFEKELRPNLYKLWNRMSSGCYFPPPVKGVAIPKKSGGERLLGIPTVGDRICQMVVKLQFEPEVEKVFLPDSYGYRPNKSAHGAIEVTRARCWKQDWVVEFDIKGLFDNLSHELLMKAVRFHTQERWVLLYIERWLKAGMQMPNNELRDRTCGTPQGGVISPVLSNLFMHYAFDRWMQRTFRGVFWCRYADDGLVHCETLAQAEQILAALRVRFKACGLEVHPDKTRIIYCKDTNRKNKYQNQSFVFLGYEFRARGCKNSKNGILFSNFSPAASPNAVKSMSQTIRETRVRKRTELSLSEIAGRFNPILRGWLNYYGRFHQSALRKVWRYVNQTLVGWARKKYKALKRCRTRASRFLARICEEQPHLFAHWPKGVFGWFA
jgi:group II intron reverse transcriptase/maturase